MANGQSDPAKTLVIVGDDGQIYKLTREVWAKDEYRVPDLGSVGVVRQLVEFGTYLAYIPPNLAVGIGAVCTVVNLKAILKNADGGSAAPAE